MDAQRRLEVLELTHNALQAERENDQSMAKAKEERLEGRVGELEKNNALLHGRVVLLEVEKAQLLVQPSYSHTSDFPNVPRELYEEWIHDEAQLDVYQDLHKVGSVSEVDLEGVHVKARDA